MLLIDSRRAPRSKARDHTIGPRDSPAERRRLDDGREFEIVKRYYEPGAAGGRAGQARLALRAAQTGEFFIYGTASR